MDTQKKKGYKISDRWSRDALNLDSFEKWSGTSFSNISCLCMIFWEKYFMLYSINWPNFTGRLFLLFEILGKFYIVIMCFLVDDVINFEISRFSTRPKKLGQIFEYLRTKKAFKVKQKTFFIIFKRLSFARSWLRPENGTWRPFWRLMDIFKTICVSAFYKIFAQIYVLTDNSQKQEYILK